MKRMLLIQFIIFLKLISCKEQKQEQEQIVEQGQEQARELEYIDEGQSTEIKEDNFKNTLIKQIEEGDQHENWKNTYQKIDLDALVYIEDIILTNNGYENPEKDVFNEKIKIIFGRTIDNQSGNSYLKIDMSDKCDKKMYYIPNSLGLNFVYVTKNYNFITEFIPLPLLFDYQKIYPDISKNEKSFWNRMDDLPEARRFNQQLLISRNKYLFNDDESQFPWLVTNDIYFMESLVTVFGYTEDEKLLNWVMGRNYKKAEYFIENYVFVKNCKGNLEIRKDILNYIGKNCNEQKTAYIEHLFKHTYYLIDSYQHENSKFNEKEKIKILAHAANIYDQLFINHHFIGKSNRGRWNILGTYFYNSSAEDWNKLKKEFILNNYYNLPNLKSLVKYAERFSSAGAPYY